MSAIPPKLDLFVSRRNRLAAAAVLAALEAEETGAPDSQGTSAKWTSVAQSQEWGILEGHHVQSAADVLASPSTAQPQPWRLLAGSHLVGALLKREGQPWLQD
jgi:hypothetical protein